ncbi:hypothetical protein QET40_12125 [Akkermansia sp. N21169]|jgi:hypothetical protein|uniref:hypothetical protein n=1 Tax=Akkermansia sp. N21169 TaxID=3040765 RepID=UPI00244ED370|nr:hypothetical protein [Akkermansia sp. N21169]MDH3069850.1 hypothetical protein [Akkermansia sp. N21169]
MNNNTDNKNELTAGILEGIVGGVEMPSEVSAYYTTGGRIQFTGPNQFNFVIVADKYDAFIAKYPSKVTFMNDKDHLVPLLVGK